MSLALNALPLKTCHAPAQPAASAPKTALLDDTEVDNLLNQLVNSRWSRLTCQDADPLGMLFNDCAKQWTMGWAPGETQAILLLTWETDSWQNKPVWSLYRNGELIFQAVDGQSLARRNWLTQLLESPNLPSQSPTEFVARLSDFCFNQQAAQAAEQLRKTAAVCPEVINAVKDVLFNSLEAELGNPEWPTLEVLKVHRLNHKTPILSLFLDWIQQGCMQDASDSQRLQRTLSQLQQDYLTLGQTIQPLFEGTYQRAYQEFRTVQTACTWRLHLMKTLPQSIPIAQPQARPLSGQTSMKAQESFDNLLTL